MNVTLADFLLARIAEDERAQNGSIGDEDWHEFRCDINRLHPETKASFPCDCGIPARVLAECEAKRQIVETGRDYSPELAAGDNGEWAFDTVLWLLAQPYADHPEFDRSWRP